MSSPEQNYFSLFAMRYPVIHCWVYYEFLWNRRYYTTGFLQLNSSQNLTWEMERACIPSNLGPPDAIVEQVELCLEGPAIAGRLELRRAATSSGSQWRTTVIRPLLSMIFQDGIWSCRPSVYRVSQTIVGMASITARNKIFFSNICGKFYEKLACFTYFFKDFCSFCNIFEIWLSS